MKWKGVEPNPSQKTVIAPPDEWPAATAGYVVNGRLRPRHLASTLFDLAQRGYLTIIQEQDDLLFHRTDKKDKDLTLAEQLMLRDFFTEYQNSIPFYRLPPRLHQLMKASKRFLQDEKKNTLANMKKDQKKKWGHFRQYLSEEKQNDQSELFGQYLAYAVTFGVEVEWALRFSDHCKAALPTWYETPYPEQQLGELVHLAQTMTKLLSKRSPAYQIVALPGAFAHIGDSGAAG